MRGIEFAGRPDQRGGQQAGELHGVHERVAGAALACPVCSTAHGLEPLQRIREVGVQRQVHGADLVGVAGIGAAPAQVQGDRGVQGALGQFRAGPEVAPQRAADHGERQRVQPGAGGIPQRAKIREREAGRLEAAARSDRLVEARARGAGQQRRSPVLAVPEQHARDLATGAQHPLRHVDAVDQLVHRRASQHLHLAQSLVGVEAVLRASGRLLHGHRREVVQCIDEDLAAGAIEQCVVQLAVDRETAARQAGHVVEALDDPRLPQRAAEIQRPGVQPRDLDAQLAPVPGRGQRDVAHVELEVEVLVDDPVRAVYAARHLLQSCAKLRRAPQATLETRDHGLEAHEAAGRGRRVVDPEPANVLWRAGQFEVDEGGVEDAELLHVRAMDSRKASQRRW